MKNQGILKILQVSNILAIIFCLCTPIMSIASTNPTQPKGPDPLKEIEPTYTKSAPKPITIKEQEEIDRQKNQEYETIKKGAVPQFKDAEYLKNKHGWYIGMGIGLSIQNNNYTTDAQANGMLKAYQVQENGESCRAYCPPVIPGIPPTPPPSYPNDIPDTALRNPDDYFTNQVMDLSSIMTNKSTLNFSLTAGYAYRPLGVRLGIVMDLGVRNYNNKTEALSETYDAIAADCPEITCNGEVDSGTGLPTDENGVIVESPVFSLETNASVYLTPNNKRFLDKLEIMLYKDFGNSVITPYLGVGLAFNTKKTIDAHYISDLAANYIPPENGADPHPPSGPDAESNGPNYDDLTAKQEIILRQQYNGYIEPVLEAGISINPNPKQNRTYIDISYKIYAHQATSVNEMTVISINKSQNSNPIDSSNPGVSYPSIIGAKLGEKVMDSNVSASIVAKERLQHKIYAGIRYFIK